MLKELNADNLYAKNICGIGTDIINIGRIKRLLAKYQDNFIKKIFHPDEIKQFNLLPEGKKLGYLAKRFAAKEATAKAFGTGIGQYLAFKDIAVMNNKIGAPIIQIDNKHIADIQKYEIHVSLSDDASFAVAFVIISK